LPLRGFTPVVFGGRLLDKVDRDQIEEHGKDQGSYGSGTGHR